MKSPFLRRVMFSGLVLLTAALLAGGCGLYTDLKTATRDMDFGLSSSPDNLNKKVVLTPVQNHSALESGGYPALFGRSFASALAGECAHVDLLRPSDPGYPAGLLKVPHIRPWLPDNLAIAQIGRSIGANAVVTATIYDISGKTERRGILWFRKSKSFVQFSVGVSAFDLETGAKIFDKTRDAEIEIDEFDLALLQKEHRIESAGLEEALQDAAGELAEAACDQLEQLPWKGFVLAASDPVLIAADSSSGLKTGDLLDVYARGEEIDGIDGQRFFLPGSKIARVRVVKVSQRTTAEVVAADEPIEPGYSVRPAQ